MTPQDRDFRRQLAIAALTGCAQNLNNKHLLNMARDAWALADALLYSEDEDSSDLWPYEVPEEADEPHLNALFDDLLPAVPQTEPPPTGKWPFPNPTEKAFAREAELEAHRQARLARLKPDTVELPIGAGMVATVDATAPSLDLTNPAHAEAVAALLMSEPEPEPTAPPAPLRRITLQQAWVSAVPSVTNGAEGTQ
jgi:hypothetical protein